MNGKKRHIIHAIVFLICLAVVFINICSVIAHSNSQPEWIHAYRARDSLKAHRNSIDVIAIGASANLCAFSPMELYEQYGISSFCAGIGYGSGPLEYYLLLSKMLKKQNPSVVLIEVGTLFFGNSEVAFRVMSDAVDVTAQKIEVLSELPDEYFEDSKLSYLFPILKYHIRYKNATEDDFFDSEKNKYYNYFLGYKMWEKVSEGIIYPMIENDESYTENQLQFRYLEKLIELCSSKQITPILYRAPCDRWSVEKYQVINEFAQDNKVKYIDFNLPEVGDQINFDPSCDFMDPAHINSRGAVKVSRYLGDFLHENFDLSDRRNDKNYLYLDEELARYQREKFNEQFIYSTTMPDYLDILKNANEDCTVIFSVKDSCYQGLDDNLKSKLRELGFTSKKVLDEPRHSFIGIWQNGGVVYENCSKGIENKEKDTLEYRGVLPDENKFYVKSAGYHVGNTSSIVIDGTEYSKNSRGFNIVVYDNANSRVVDSIAFDTHADAGITYKR